MFSPETFFPLLFSFWDLSLRERIKWITTLNQYGNFYAYISDVSPTVHSPDLDESGRSYARNRLQWKFPEFGPIHCNSKGIGVYIRNQCHSLSRPLKAILIFLNEPPSPLALERWYSTAKVQTSGRDFAVGCMIPQVTSEQTHAKAAEKYHCQEPGSAKVNTSFIKKNVTGFLTHLGQSFENFIWFAFLNFMGFYLAKTPGLNSQYAWNDAHKHDRSLQS